MRACGYINPKGFARGRRTIAGTLILTQFTVDVLFRFLQAVLPNDYSKDTTYVKIDQLPTFNLTLLFADEYGNASYRRLLGVDFITDGTVYSIQDLLTEETISYMASDFTPLLPVIFGRSDERNFVFYRSFRRAQGWLNPFPLTPSVID